jgi:hypothetical protein
MDIAFLQKCCGEKNIRVRDIFFWNEQYLQKIVCGEAKHNPLDST